MKKLIVLIMVLGLTLCVGTAFAAIQGSSHDIPDWSGNLNEGDGACSFCHIPHGAAGARLFPAQIDTTGFTIGWRDPLSMMCYDCHVVNAAASYAEAENPNMFETAAHAYDTSILETWGDLTNAERSGIDTVVYLADATRINCVSCHNIHDNSVRPFLRNNPGVAGGAALVAGDLGTLCDDCHLHRFDDAGTGEHSNHPVDVSWNSTNGRASILVFQVGVPVRYEVPWADLTVISAKPGGVPGSHWNLGGKVLYSAGEVDEFDCATCHAVHSNETTTWDEAGAGDGDTFPVAVVGFPGNNLLIQDDQPDMATPADAPICLDCHDVAAVRGPGATGASHPWATTFTNGFVTVPSNGEPALGSDVLVCQDCHDMHFSRLGAATDTPAGAASYMLVRNECEDCHTSTNGIAAHHPVGTVTLGVDTDLATPLVVTDYDWSSVALSTDGITVVTPTTTAYYFGPADNTMTCNTCHSGGNASAHNITGNFPGLTGEIDESEMCVDCHGVNPSDNTATEGQTQADPRGSHMVGAYTNTSYYWQDSSITPAAIDSAKQSADATQSLICESCHTLKIDGRNGHTVVNQMADNTTASGAEGRDWSLGGNALLLTQAGNAREDAGAATGYLCTACHSTTPGGGSTHPVIHGPGMSAASVTVQGGANPAANGVSLTPNDFVNCESCHQPHDADTDADSLILELASLFGVSGNLNETDLCAECHTDKYY